MVYLDEGSVRIVSRNQNDITDRFPELQAGDKAFRATSAVFDCEIVSLDPEGKPIFKKVINRLMTRGESTIAKLAKSNPVNCYVFDCLYLDGRPLVSETLMKRREWMRDAIKTDSPYRVSEVVDDGQGLFEAAKAHRLEGIMAKMRDSKYLPGRRSPSWLKIKVWQAREVLIIGYTRGKGDRDETFGALHIAEREKDALLYRGKVGTGFDDESIRDIKARLKKLKETKKPTTKKLADDKITTWIEPKMYAEVSYTSITTDKIFREPVFVRLRPDLEETE